MTVLLIVLAAAFGFLGAPITGTIFQIYDLSFYRRETRVYPLPHHIPKYPGGVSLRFAMVHDVIHERFARHGQAYYTERNRLVRQSFKDDQSLAPAEGQLTERHFGLLDDLGVGLDHLGAHEEAVRVLRTKLRQQESLKQTGRALYTTYANLGTFLIHGNYRRASTGDAAAKERLCEGLVFIRKSIDVNPEAHFGREVWQAVAVEFLLAALENPPLLLQFDMAGDSLWRDIDPWQNRSIRDAAAWGIAGDARFAAKYLKNPDEYLKGSGGRSGPVTFRGQIACVGAEAPWNEVVKSSHRGPVYFDEPVLGIIGMWRLGGGANPQFALTLGEIMLRVGQRYVAWCAYERAVHLADRFGPTPQIRTGFVEHCRRRQAVIEGELPDAEREVLRPRFEAELAYGLRYQQDYDRYEANRIAQGASLDDPHFYDDFHAQHGPIASPVGEADQFLAENYFSHFPLPYMVLSAGVCAFFVAVLWWRWS
jgi:hypothetical protein